MKNELLVRLKLNSNIDQLFSDLLDEMHEMLELIPDWNYIERNNFCEKIKEIMGQILVIDREISDL